MEERRLATISKPPQRSTQMTLADFRRDMTSSTAGYTYNVNGKEGISALAARALAVEFHIQTQIVDCGKTNEKAWCTMRGWIGDKDKPEKQAETVVIFIYEHLKQQLVFDAIEGGFFYPTTGERNNYGKFIKSKRVPKFEMGDHGFPILTDPWAQFQIMANYLDKIKFAERTVAGMAERNVICHLLGREDDGAIEVEKSEITKEEQPSELDVCTNRIRTLLMKASNNNKNLAIEMFTDIAKPLGIDASIPADLKTLEDARKILNEILSQTKKTESIVEEVETEAHDQ